MSSQYLAGKNDWTQLLAEGFSYRDVINQFADSKEFREICAGLDIKTGMIILSENRDRNFKITQLCKSLFALCIGSNHCT